MRALVQRVTRAEVEVAGNTVGRIGRGLLVLLGVKEGDGESEAARLARKITSLRVFDDEAGKMNLDLKATGGAVLVVSQFTLYADLRRGNRPSFSRSGDPSRARFLYESFVQRLREAGVEVATGVFGAHMLVSLVNDGPVTLLLDNEALTGNSPSA